MSFNNMSVTSIFSEMKSIQTSSTANTKTFETSASINLRPPPIDRNKSFDEDDFSGKPIVTKKVNTAPINAALYSVADLQMATDSFSAENLIGEGSLGRVYRAQFDDGKVCCSLSLGAYHAFQFYDINTYAHITPKFHALFQL